MRHYHMGNYNGKGIRLNAHHIEPLLKGAVLAASNLINPYDSINSAMSGLSLGGKGVGAQKKIQPLKFKL